VKLGKISTLGGICLPFSFGAGEQVLLLLRFGPEPTDMFLRNVCLKFEYRPVASSWMLRRVALTRADVSEELSGSCIRVTRIGVLGTMLVTATVVPVHLFLSP
jgi:hypothetical protein